MLNQHVLNNYERFLTEKSDLAYLVDLSPYHLS